MPPAMRPVPVQESPVSRPRAVYSIDQILGNQHQSSKRSGKFKKKKKNKLIKNKRRKNDMRLDGGPVMPSVFSKTEEF